MSYEFRDGGVIRPSRTVLYTGDSFVGRRVNRSPSGRPLIIGEADDILAIRLDFSQITADGDSIIEATAKPAGCSADLQYDTLAATLTVSSLGECGAVSIFVRFLSGETFTDLISVRRSQRRGDDQAITAAPQRRGIP